MNLVKSYLVVSQSEWLTARTALLTKEKEMTHQRDALNTERGNLPMVAITKESLAFVVGAVVSVA